jgi:glutaredoxin-like protein
MLENKEGQRVPDVTFKTRKDHQWREVTSRELFDGRTVVVFSLPGAFTPTCSSAHVPRYNELAAEFRKNGVDAILCVSVNDAFVMDEWQRDQKAWNIEFIPDGTGEFTRKMGMLVKDGVIEKMFIEPEKPGDPYEVSDADTMLDYINPKAGRPADITVVTRSGCPFCARAKGLLRDRGLEFEEIVLNGDITRRSLRALARSESVPQVFINGELVGGTDGLERWLEGRRAA